LVDQRNLHSVDVEQLPHCSLDGKGAVGHMDQP
jgi:hypothetical protein